MKTFKKSISALFMLLIVSNIFISCSNQEESNNELSQKQNIELYLKHFYNNKKTKLGNSVESRLTQELSTTSKSVEIENLIITEVYVGNDERARGYIISDKETSNFLYFIDVDRVDFKLTSYKVETDETKVFENIEQLDKYLSTDEFDYIKIAEDYNIEQSTERRFWGWQSWSGPCDETTGQSTLMETYYVFGVGVKTRKVVGIDGGDVIQPCAGGALLDD